MKTKDKLFTIKLDNVWYKKDDILTTPDDIKVKVTKVYKYNWWRKILNFFGVKFKLFNCVQVEELPFDEVITFSRTGIQIKGKKYHIGADPIKKRGRTTKVN